MIKNTICSKCKIQIPYDYKFCPKCGLKLSMESEHFSRTKKNKTKFPKFFLISGLTILIVLIAVGGTYEYGKIRYSRERQLSQIAKKITSINPEDIADVSVNSKKQPFDPEELKPLARLYKKNAEERTVIAETVKNGETNGTIKITKVGNIFGIYPRYRVMINPVIFTIKTNLEHPTISIDANTVEYSGNDPQIIEMKLPGEYTVDCVGFSDNSKKKLSKKVLLSPIEKKKLISFTVKKDPKPKLENPDPFTKNPDYGFDSDENSQEDEQPRYNLLDQIKNWLKTQI